MRRLSLLVSVGVLLLAGTGPRGDGGQAAPREYAVKRQSKVMIPMRDGVRLAAEVFRPDAPGKFPALMCLRYWQTGVTEATAFARRGYVALLVDSRGRGNSEGKWEFYVHEPRDGYDAQQWVGEQDWCDGKVGMFGQSYNAFTQLMPAPLGSPYVKCLFPHEGQQTNF